MFHARLTFRVAATASLLACGCAGPGWFAHGEYPMSRARPATETSETRPSPPLEAAQEAKAQNSEPSLSKVLDDLERIKYQSPSDFKVIQSAVEDTSSLFPPELQQLYKDQMVGLAARNQQPQTRSTFEEQTTPPTVDPALVATPQHVAVQARTLPSPVPVTSVPSSVPSEVSPASYVQEITTDAATSLPQAAFVATHVSDVSTAIPAQPPAVTPAPVVAPTAVPATDQAPESVAKSIEPGQWSRDVEKALTSLMADLARPNLDKSEHARLEVMRRLLYVVTNQRDEAVSPIDQLDEDEREYWKHQIHGLLVSIDTEGKHPTTRRAALALRDLRTATDHLANVSTLDVRNLTFCREVLSYGEYRVFDSYTFRAKDEVVLYVEIDNFAAHPRGDSFETELHSSYEITDDAGRRVANVVLPVDKQVSSNRRRDYFIAYLITMPSQINSGSYRLQLTVEDVIGKKSNHAAIDFRIQ